MMRGVDVTGIRLRLGGRSPMATSNTRRFSKSYFYGSLIGARYYNKKMNTNTTIYSPISRGTIKSNIDYICKPGISKKGVITLKV
jgi:hypothetical protein